MTATTWASGVTRHPTVVTVGRSGSEAPERVADPAEMVAAPLAPLLTVVAREHASVEFRALLPEIWGRVESCEQDGCPGALATVLITWEPAGWVTSPDDQIGCCPSCAPAVLGRALGEARHGSRVTVEVLDDDDETMREVA